MLLQDNDDPLERIILPTLVQLLAGRLWGALFLCALNLPSFPFCKHNVMPVYVFPVVLDCFACLRPTASALKRGRAEPVGPRTCPPSTTHDQCAPTKPKEPPTLTHSSPGVHESNSAATRPTRNWVASTPQWVREHSFQQPCGHLMAAIWVQLFATPGSLPCLYPLSCSPTTSPRSSTTLTNSTPATHACKTSHP